MRPLLLNHPDDVSNFFKLKYYEADFHSSGQSLSKSIEFLNEDRNQENSPEHMQEFLQRWRKKIENSPLTNSDWKSKSHTDLSTPKKDKENMLSILKKSAISRLRRNENRRRSTGFILTEQ